MLAGEPPITAAVLRFPTVDRRRRTEDNMRRCLCCCGTKTMKKRGGISPCAAVFRSPESHRRRCQRRVLPDPTAFWDGAILLAPMCKIADDVKPNGLVISALTRRVTKRASPGKVSILSDGSIIVEVGGIEPGQGLWTKAYSRGLSLSASGYFVPDSNCSRYLNYGATVSEIEGAFVQGIGFFMSEEYLTNADGLVVADNTWTYMIPTIDTIPDNSILSYINYLAVISALEKADNDETFKQELTKVS
ncbi:hypothetical protein AgCh_020674 [Apium graveolens]